MLICVGIVLVAACALLMMGRVPWCTCGEVWLWSGDVNSSNNSQHISDPYTLTHITHGIGFYGLFALVAPEWSLGARLVGTVLAESTWEVLENTSFVIERYRATTISLNYYGDGVINSIGDILACIIGFFIASRLPRWASALGVIVLEVMLALWIRDSLLLNIIMLIYPIQVVKVWQARM